MGRCGCGTWPPAPPRGEPLTGHDGAVEAVAVGELDGRAVIVSGGEDGTVRVWDLAAGAAASASRSPATTARWRRWRWASSTAAR